MPSLFRHITINHLRLLSVGIVALAIVWIAVAWMFSADRIWVVPGVFLLFTGVVKLLGVQVWSGLDRTTAGDGGTNLR